MKNMKLALLAGVAVIGSVGLGGSANAQTATATQAIYGGGSTLASRVYRQLFDCWGIPATGGLPTFAVSPNFTCIDPTTGNPSTTGDIGGTTVQILYAPVGSGAGKRAYANHERLAQCCQGLRHPCCFQHGSLRVEHLPRLPLPRRQYPVSPERVQHHRSCTSPAATT